MPTEISFPTLKDANDLRDSLSQYLSPSDSRRSKTVVFENNTPSSLIDRARNKAFGAGEGGRQSAGQKQLSKSEKQSLEGTTSFDWQTHGFEAMAAKSALESRGVTEWIDYYSPGEGISSSLDKLRRGKQDAARGRGQSAVGGIQTDTDEQRTAGRRQRQAEQTSAAQARSAKQPAFEGDTDAIDFLEEERQFDPDVFDVSFDRDSETGMPTATGADVEQLQEANQNRSSRAVVMDDQNAAPITYDPLEWSQNKSTTDFPGVDTLDPEALQPKDPGEIDWPDID